MEKMAALDALGGLAHENRLDVFRHLVELGPGGAPAGRISSALNLAPATLSFHLKEMKVANLVTCRRDGRSLIYAAAFDAMNELIAYLTDNCCRGGIAACDAPARPKTKSST
jgi:ArsR family transcriptional regulator